MSRGSKIYKRFGLKFALAYRLRKIKRKILGKTFVQKFLMLYFLFNLQRDFKAFGIYRTLRQQNILITNPKNLQFILQHYELILEWLNSKEFKEQYLDTKHPYPPLLNPERLNAHNVPSLQENVTDETTYKDSNCSVIASETKQSIILQTNNSNNEMIKKQKLKDEILSFGLPQDSNESLARTKSQPKPISPYPNLSYESIPAGLAWDLNLPLPRNYRAILPLFGLSGHWAFSSFISKCGDTRCSLCNGLGSVKVAYQNAYISLLNNKFHFLVHLNYMHNAQDRKHILSLADAKVPVLILLRDPIGRLKHGVNHGNFKTKQSVYDIDNPKEAINRITYGRQDKPSLDILEVECVYTKAQKIWQYYQTIQEIRNASSIHYLDMQEIVGERTFNTMMRLSQEFGFPAPKSEDRKFYESKINNQYRYLLPITFEVNEEIKILVQQNIYVPQDKIDILSKLSLDSLGLQVGFFVSVEQWNELQKDKDLMQKVAIKLQDYLFALKEKTRSIEANKVTESQVLDYLREHKETRQIYKSYFDKEFVHIKQTRPDIVESWKYYQEFERMCEEMDGNVGLED